jgi:hypothetical protein
VLQIVVTLLLLDMLTPAPEQRPSARRHLALFVILTLCAVGVSSKLSFAAFGVTSAVIVCGVWARQQWRDSHSVSAALPVLLRCATLGAVIGGGWLLRGVLLTGYPLFPSRVAALNVAFRVPQQTAREAELWVYSFARQPGGDMERVLSNWDWLSGWWGLMQESFIYFLFVTPLRIALAMAVMLLGLGLAALLQRRRWGVSLSPLVAALPATVAAMYWFLSAPDPRFAGAAFWVLAALSTAVMTCHLPGFAQPSANLLLRLVSVGSMGVTAVLFGTALRTGFRLESRVPTLNRPRLIEYRMESGLVYNMSGNRNDPLSLYNAPLPNSPYQHPTLELRGATVRDGFRFRER